MREAFSHTSDTILVRPARWDHSVKAQRHKWRQEGRQSTTKALGATVAIVAVMAPLSSAWMQLVSLTGSRALHEVQLGDFRQARVCTGYGGQLANKHLPISWFRLQRPWYRHGVAEFGCDGKVALSAKKKKKKQVDADVLEKRARAAAIREEAIKRAAETKRLKELGQSAESATAKPIEVAKKASTPDRVVAKATTVSATRAALKATTASATRKLAPTAKGRKHPASVAEMRAIQAIDRKTQQGAKTETRKETSQDVNSRPTKAEVMKMKVIDLKDVLRAARLKVGGRKAELLERVLDYIEA